MAQPARKGPGPFAGPRKDLPAPLKGTDGRCRGLAPPPSPTLTFQATWPN